MQHRVLVPVLAPVLAVAALSAVAPSASAQGRPSVRIEQAAVRVVVIPEARRDVAVSVRPGASGLPTVRVRREGAVTVVDGALPPGMFDRMQKRPAAAECASGARPSVKVRGMNWRVDQLPEVTVRVPLNVAVQSSGAVYGRIGPTTSVTLTSDGCGEWLMGSVPTLAIVHNGEGLVRAQDAAGSLNVQVTGKGLVQIVRGFTAKADLVVTGSGRIDHKGDVGRMTAEVRGSGFIDIARVSGTVEKNVRGSGDVRYRRPPNSKYRMGD